MEKVTVSADALYRILNALNGPAHHIRELQVTRNIARLPEMEPNPINTLVDEYNAAVEEYNKSIQTEETQKG